MYFNEEHLWYNHPQWQTSYFYSTPFQSENFYDGSFYDRQFGPMGPPPGQGTQAGAPTSPPPSYVPMQTQQASAFAVDPGSIRGCLFRYTYVWLNNRQQFWYYPTFVGRTSVSGWRWNGFMWVFFGISLRQIQSFTCF